MSQEVRICPHCGAYVMSDDNFCPRCYRALDVAPADSPSASPTHSSATDSPSTAPDAAPDSAWEIETAGFAAPQEPAPSELAHWPVEGVPEPDHADLPTTELPHVEALPDSAGEAAAVSDEPKTLTFALESPVRVNVGSGEAETVTLGPGEVRADEAPAFEPVREERPTIRPAEAGEPPAEGVTVFQQANEPASELTTEPETSADLDLSEMPTARFASELQVAPDEPQVRIGSQSAPAQADEPLMVGSVMATPRRQKQEDLARPYLIPPAPYTAPPAATPPPPAVIAPPIPAYAPSYGYSYPPSAAYLQQRIQVYINGGYRLVVQAPHEASLARGKNLGVGGWLLALVTLIGALWYLLILAASGFSKDMAYLVIESDGHLYEDGPGAAHIRQGRSRAGRRWSVFGLILFLISLLVAGVLAAAAAVVLTQDRYQAALREAYPAVTLFEERFSSQPANPDDVPLVKNGAVAFSILAGMAAVGLWSGATLFVIGSVHAAAYRVRVPPLPGYA